MSFIKLRRRLLEHLPRLSPNAVKLYVYLLLKVKATGVDRGVYRAATRAMSEDLAMRRESMLGAIRELESLSLKPFIEVRRAPNQHGLTEYRVARFSPSAGPESGPLEPCSAGPDSGPAAGPADLPKQLHINGLETPKKVEKVKNSAGAKFQPAKNGSYPTWFESLWASYPSRKGSKKAAFGKAAKVVVSDGDAELALRYLAIRASHMESMKARGAFVENLPHVERYFSKGLWSQEPEPETTAQDGDGFRRSWE